MKIMETKMQQALPVDKADFRESWEESKLLHLDLKNSFTEWKEGSNNENV